MAARSLAAREGNHANLAVLFEKVGAVDLSEVMILAGQPKERNNFHMELPFQQFSQANRSNDLVERVDRPAKESNLLAPSYAEDRSLPQGSNVLQCNGIGLEARVVGLEKVTNLLPGVVHLAASCQCRCKPRRKVRKEGRGHSLAGDVVKVQSVPWVDRLSIKAIQRVLLLFRQRG